MVIGEKRRKKKKKDDEERESWDVYTILTGLLGQVQF